MVETVVERSQAFVPEHCRTTHREGTTRGARRRPRTSRRSPRAALDQFRDRVAHLGSVIVVVVRTGGVVPLCRLEPLDGVPLAFSRRDLNLVPVREFQPFDPTFGTVDVVVVVNIRPFILIIIIVLSPFVRVRLSTFQDPAPEFVFAVGSFAVVDRVRVVVERFEDFSNSRVEVGLESLFFLRLALLVVRRVRHLVEWVTRECVFGHDKLLPGLFL